MPGRGQQLALERELARERVAGRRPPPGTCPSPPARPPRRADRGPGPSLRRLPGARLTTTRRSGHSRPAALDRRADPIARVAAPAAPGRPVSVSDGSPRPTYASTVTRCPPTPSTVTPKTRPYMARTLRPATPRDRDPGHRRVEPALRAALVASPRCPTVRLEPGTRADRRPRRGSLARGLEELGEATWREALDWLYGEAMRAPDARRHLPGGARARSSGRPARPAAAPDVARRHRRDVLAEFRERVAPATYNAQHPGSFSYFTPPPLPDVDRRRGRSRQWIQPGRRRVARRPDRRRSWRRRSPAGSATSSGSARRLGASSPRGGVMANIMALTVARDVWLAEAPRARRRHRGARSSRTCASTSATRRTSRSRAALDMLGFPEDTLRVLAVATSGSGCSAGPVAARDRRGPRRRAARRSRSPPSPARRTPARSTTCRGSPTSPSASRSGCTSTRRTGAPRACRRATPTACPGLERADSRHGRSAQVVLPGLRHRRAGRAPPRGPARTRSTRAPEYYRVAPAPRTSRCTGTSTRSRARAGSAR